MWCIWWSNLTADVERKNKKNHLVSQLLWFQRYFKYTVPNLLFSIVILFICVCMYSFHVLKYNIFLIGFFLCFLFVLFFRFISLNGILLFLFFSYFCYSCCYCYYSLFCVSFQFPAQHIFQSLFIHIWKAKIQKHFFYCVPLYVYRVIQS